MITPAEFDLNVQRHAPFPSVDPWSLRDRLTGVPIDLTGATITLQVRLYEGAAGDPLLFKVMAVVDGPRGLYGPPEVSEAEHEALLAAATADPNTLQGRLKLRYDVKFAGVTGLPAAFIGLRGFYYVQTGVNV